MQKKWLASLVAATYLLAAPTWAKDNQLISETTHVSKILEIAGEFGKTELTKDSSGDPLIYVTTPEDVKYGIYFYDCKKQQCEAMQFAASWEVKTPPTLQRINSWNQSKRFGRAYLDDKNVPFVEMDLTVKGGVTTENLRDAFEYWNTVITHFPNIVLD